MNRSKEKFFTVNHLTCLIQGITGCYTHIDLRNDSVVSGKLDQVDGFMNIVVSDAVYTTPNGVEFYYELFFIKERNIRYIHIPEEISIESLLIALKPKNRREQPSRPRSLKMKRLLERQRETKARVEEIKRERLQKKLLKQQQSVEKS